MFIPATRNDMDRLGWDSLDIILVSGDTYIDSSYNGSAIIGHWLIENGFKVGIIAQPDINGDDIERLGRPSLFWSVSSGCVDSMVANYTATGKFRKEDDFTPGGVNKRPDRACIAYTNLIRKHFKGSMVVLGGIEASLRRIAHYDLWSDSVRRSILFDSKADVITYGMSELANLRLAEALRDGTEWRDIKGICYISRTPKDSHLIIPSFESCSEKDAFIESFNMFYYNCDPITAKGMVQAHGDRYLVHNPPSESLDQGTLDRIYEMDFENRVHPFYAKMGDVRAMDTIKQSLTTHRGCYGECNFCAIAVHQGRTVISRSADSIVRETERMSRRRNFNGIIYDVGGPTANMYGIECLKKMSYGACADRKCLFPRICDRMPIDHTPQVDLLKRISDVDGVRKVFVNSGIRHDMIMADRNRDAYMNELIANHVSGQLKVAPEHVSEDVLTLMGKPGRKVLMDFKNLFDEKNKELGKDQYLTYYFMAAHPGCYDKHMKELDDFIHSRLRTNPEQVQIFTPTPSTVSTMMYHTRRDPKNKKDIKAEHSMQMKVRQKKMIVK